MAKAQTFTPLTAKNEAQKRGLRPQDYGSKEWDYQTLANALNADILQSGSSRNPRTLAKPILTPVAPTLDSVSKDIDKYGIDYTARFANPFDGTGYKSSGLTEKGYSVAVAGFNDRLTKLQQAAMQAGMTPEEFQNKIDLSNKNAQDFYTKANKDFRAKDNRGGLVGFLDKATPAITKAGAAYISGGILSNAMGAGSLAAGGAPAVTTPQMMIPGTSIPVTTAVNAGKTAYNVATSKNPGSALTNAAFNLGTGNKKPMGNWQDLEVVQKAASKVPGLVRKALLTPKG
jgi:hypothetical protein